MIGYAQARAMAKAGRDDWNERECIAKAIITWYDEDWEYELEIENEDYLNDKEFTKWVEENAEDLCREEAIESETTFEGIDRIKYEDGFIDDDRIFEKEYDAYCEFEWECATGR